MSRLSYSQVSKYTQCGESYRLHYIEKLRPKTTTGALLFGSALDNALNVLLLGGPDVEKEFDDTFRNQKINGKDTYIPTSTLVLYSATDFDADLLVQDDYDVFNKTKELQDFKGEWPDLVKEMQAKKSASGYDALSHEEKVLLGLGNWLSMRRKGLLMIEAYRKKIIPKINKVLGVQKFVKLDNGAGDTIIGFVDLIADFDDYGPVILDNKTSILEYDKDSVLTSPQLSMYVNMLSEEYGTRKGGYIVMRKSIKKNREKVCSVCGHDGSGGRHKTCDAVVEGKRCGGTWNETLRPEVVIQVIVDEIPLRTEEIVMENLDLVNNGIKNEVFTRNLGMCKNYFGGLCPYFNKCYKNKDEGLEQC